MTDTVQEIEGVVTALEGIAPALGGVVSALVPGAAPAMTLAVPILSIINEILAAVETLKSNGTSHEAAVAVVGHAVASIGQTLIGAVPMHIADAAAPAALVVK